MSHLYPLAASAADAIASPEPAARTRYEADDLAGDASIAGLETEWITPAEKDRALYEKAADDGVGAGFVQRYEDASGAPVYAVTYWKLHAAAKKASGKSAPEPAPEKKTKDDKTETDELYFRRGGNKTARRKRVKKVDPRQLDLFSGPDQQGYEYRDPDNPGVIIADEEGDGTAFGIAPKPQKKPKKKKK